MLRETVLEMEKQLGQADHRTLVCEINLAFALEHLEQLDEAHKILSESLPHAEKIFGESHVHTISARNNSAKVVCNLVDAQQNYFERWRMDKYQQKLVRKNLKSLLSVPLFRTSPSEDEKFVGVLNFDSEEDLCSQFEQFIDQNGQDDLNACTQLVVDTLYHRS